MQLAPNWAVVLRRAWSLRFTVAAFIFTLAEVALQLLTPAVLGIPSATFAVLAGICSAAAFVSRLIAQQGISHANDH